MSRGCRTRLCSTRVSPARRSRLHRGRVRRNSLLEMVEASSQGHALPHAAHTASLARKCAGWIVDDLSSLESKDSKSDETASAPWNKQDDEKEGKDTE